MIASTDGLRWFWVWFVVLLLNSGCSSGQDLVISKVQVGQFDDDQWLEDYCQTQGWYQDGVCDGFCPLPEPDCSEECAPLGTLHCQDGLVCIEGECVVPSPSANQQTQIDLVQEAIDQMLYYTGWVDDFDLGLEDLADQVWWTIVEGDESDSYLYQAMRLALLAFPVGHQVIYLADTNLCSQKEMFWQSASRLGVCARPYGDDFVITHVLDGNPLGLQAGDRIRAVAGLSGTDMVEEVLRYPVCGSASASPANRRIAAATSLFSSIPEGTRLDIVHIDGSQSQLEIPPAEISYLDCRYPRGGDMWFNARTTLLANDIAVITLPRLYPTQATGNEGYDELIDMMKSSVQEAFDQAKHAQGIIWDLRANVGGITPIGLEIVGGMPTARAQTIAFGGRRIPGSKPVTLTNEFEYAVQPGGDFSYQGKVAVLADGLSVSAADYFLLAIAEATDVPIIGTGAAGAYGGSGFTVTVGNDPSFIIGIDPYRIEDAQGQVLEGYTVDPHRFVEQDPEDLSQGIDTQLQAAIALLLE